MKNISKILVLAAAFLMAFGSVQAEKYKGGSAVPRVQTRAAATCLPASNSNQLLVNNVRAYLETNGTMWFEEIAQYEIPYGSGKTSMFAAALWIGGLDINSQLKLAAVRFRQRGDDFWTGPLTLNGASITQQTCADYDKFYKITRAEVENHKLNWDNAEYTMPNSIRDWPAHPYDLSAGQSFYLAPFFDYDEDGEYKNSIGYLYGIAYTIKMSYKGPHRIDGYFEYVVPPLEGFWWQDGMEGIDYSRKDLMEFISVNEWL